MSSGPCRVRVMYAAMRAMWVIGTQPEFVLRSEELRGVGPDA